VPSIFNRFSLAMGEERKLATYMLIIAGGWVAVSTVGQMRQRPV